MRTITFSAIMALLLCWAPLGLAQGTGNEFPWQISDLSLSIGEVRGQRSVLTPEEALAKFPSSTILQDDYSAYYVHGSNWNYGLGEQPTVQFSMGLRKSSSPEHSLLARISSFRLGASMMGLSTETGHWSQTATGPYDTLTSSATGQQILIDSVRYSGVYYYSNQLQFQLSAAWMLDIVRSPKWHIQAGVAASGGLVMDHYTQVLRDDFTRYQQQYQPGQTPNGYYFSYGGDIQGSYERTFQSPSVTGAVSIPVSVCYNLGRGLTDKLQLGVTYEAKPTMLLGGKTDAYACLVQQVGVRFMLPDKSME